MDHYSSRAYIWLDSSSRNYTYWILSANKFKQPAACVNASSKNKQKQVLIESSPDLRIQ